MADRYWVGGTGSWTSTANWSATSGGTPGASVPTISDNVFIDNNSFLPGGSFQISVPSSLSVADLTVTRTNGNVIWNPSYTSNNININGNLSLNSSLTSFNSAITFTGSSFATAYMSGGLTWSITIDKTAGGRVTLLSNIDTRGYNPATYGVNPLTFTRGYLDLNGYNLTTSNFSSSNSNSRAIEFGGGNIILTLVYNSTANTTLIFSMTNVTGFSNVDDSGYFVLQGAGPSLDVYVPSNGDDSNTVSFHVNSPHIYRFSFAFSTTAPVTISGLRLSNGSITTPDVSNTLGFPPIIYMYGDLVIDGTATTYAEMRMVSSTRNQTISGGAGTLTRVNRSWFYQQGFQTITLTLRPSLIIQKSGGTFANLDQNLTLVNMLFQLSSGGLNTNDYTVSVGAFWSSSTSVRELNIGNSDWVISSSDSNYKYWNTSTTTNLTFTFDPSNQASISLSSTGTQTFRGGGLSFPELIITTASTVTIFGNNEFVDISNTAQPCTVSFEANTTNTFDNFSLSGTSGNLVTIYSNSTLSPFYLQTNGNDVNVSFCSIARSIANNVDVNWNAFLVNGNVDAGSNDGWRFYEVEGGAFMAFF